MNSLQTEILVIGGGSTGTGVLRDAAMRGFKAVLVEKQGLNNGTTGRYHGLLHSGGRYAVTDPEAARECIQENQILRQIMPQALDQTDGYFVQLPGDDPDFGDVFLRSCAAAGIPVESVPVPAALRAVPTLNPKVERVFQVPDAVSYAAAATNATVASALEYGAQVLVQHEVIELLRDDQGRVVGAKCFDHSSGQEIVIHADMVINAAGAVSNKISGMLGIDFQMVPGKGTMVAVDHLPLGMVLNRLRTPSDGDIIVPLGGEAVVGTTDIMVRDAEDFRIEPEEIAQMLAAGEEMMPGYSQVRSFRAWAGVRPLQPQQPGGQDRQITRGYSLIDHEREHAVPGFVTITGGKWTTHRLMAEVTLDLVCEKLGVQRPCRTHLEAMAEVTDSEMVTAS